MKLSEQIRKKYENPFKRIAEKTGVSIIYVRMVANGDRVPTKKKGLEVLKALQELAQ